MVKNVYFESYHSSRIEIYAMKSKMWLTHPLEPKFF